MNSFSFQEKSYLTFTNISNKGNHLHIRRGYILLSNFIHYARRDLVSLMSLH